VLARVRRRKRDRCAPFCNPGLPAWAKLCRGYDAKEDGFAVVVPLFTAFPRESYQSTLLLIPARAFAKVGWVWVAVESKKLRKENFKFEIPPLRSG
jgi:hypothetical protein